MRLFGFLRRNRRWERQVDAHIDGRLSPVERALLAERLEESDTVRRTLHETIAIKRALRAMPEQPVPRSFAITEAMLAPQTPARPAHPRGVGVTMRLSQATAFAAVAAFGVVVAFDYSGSGQDQSTAAGGDGAFNTMIAEDSATKAGDAGIAAPEVAPAGASTETSGDDGAREAGPDTGGLEQVTGDGDATAIALAQSDLSNARDYRPIYVALAGVLVLAAGAWALSRRQLAHATTRSS